MIDITKICCENCGSSKSQKWYLRIKDREIKLELCLDCLKELRDVLSTRIEQEEILERKYPIDKKEFDKLKRRFSK